jgi:hypothetical protein
VKPRRTSYLYPTYPNGNQISRRSTIKRNGIEKNHNPNPKRMSISINKTSKSSSNVTLAPLQPNNAQISNENLRKMSNNRNGIDKISNSSVNLTLTALNSINERTSTKNAKRMNTIRNDIENISSSNLTVPFSTATNRNIDLEQKFLVRKPSRNVKTAPNDEILSLKSITSFTRRINSTTAPDMTRDAASQILLLQERR